MLVEQVLFGRIDVAGGITLTPVSVSAAPSMTGTAGAVADGAGDAGFGSLLGLAMASVAGKDALAALQQALTQSTPDSEAEQHSANSDDSSLATQTAAAGVLAQLMVVANNVPAIQPQALGIREGEDGRLAALTDGTRPAKGKAIAVADVKAGLRQIGERVERDIGALESLATSAAGAVARKHGAENFAAGGNILPERKTESGVANVPDSKLLMSHGAVPAHEARPVIVATSDKVVSVVGRPGWGEELGQKMVLMVRGNQQSAELQLNPPNLGPLEVRLSLQNDQASLMFVSAHSSVRDAINAALPKLSSMFAESGISMGSVLVGDQSLAQQNQSQRQFEQQSRRSSRFAADAPDVTVQRFDLPLGKGQGWAVSMFV